MIFGFCSLAGLSLLWLAGWGYWRAYRAWKGASRQAVDWPRVGFILALPFAIGPIFLILPMQSLGRHLHLYPAEMLKLDGAIVLCAWLYFGALGLLGAMVVLRRSGRTVPTGRRD